MPIKLSKAEHERRKEATRKYFEPKVEIQKIDGKDVEVVTNPEVLSKTSQAHRESCDINAIMKRAEGNGFVIDPARPLKQGRFGDFTNVPTYQESLRIANAVRDEFMALPPEVRAKFGNDPAALLRFVEDPANEEESIRLKLLPEPVIETKKHEGPEGNFWVTTRNGKEIKRVEIVTGKPAEKPAEK